MNIIERVKRLFTDTSMVKEELKLVEHNEKVSVKTSKISEPIITLADMILDFKFEYSVEPMFTSIGNTYKKQWLFYMPDSSVLRIISSHSYGGGKSFAGIEDVQMTEDESIFLGEALENLLLKIQEKEKKAKLDRMATNRNRLEALLCGEKK